MKLIKHNPESLYSIGGSFAHGVEVVEPRRLLYTSGTLGIAKDFTPPADAEAQFELLWANLREILAGADMGITNIVKVTTFISDKAYRSVANATRRKTMGDHSVATTVIVVELLETSWLAEIEIVAAA